MKVRAKLHRIARSARYWAEQEAKKDNFYPDLTAFCARGAAELFRRLKSVGLKPRLVETRRPYEAHIYVQCCGYIIDTTASQFGEPKVIVRRKGVKKHEDAWYWTSIWKTFTSVGALQKNQKRTRWPEEQIAR